MRCRCRHIVPNSRRPSPKTTHWKTKMAQSARSGHTFCQARANMLGMLPLPAPACQHPFSEEAHL